MYVRMTVVPFQAIHLSFQIIPLPVTVHTGLDRLVVDCTG